MKPKGSLPFSYLASKDSGNSKNNIFFRNKTLLSIVNVPAFLINPYCNVRALISHLGIEISFSFGFPQFE